MDFDHLLQEGPWSFDHFLLVIKKSLVFLIRNSTILLLMSLKTTRSSQKKIENLRVQKACLLQYLGKTEEMVLFYKKSIF